MRASTFSLQRRYARCVALRTTPHAWLGHGQHALLVVVSAPFASVSSWHVRILRDGDRRRLEALSLSNMGSRSASSMLPVQMRMPTSICACEYPGLLKMYLCFWVDDCHHIDCAMVACPPYQPLHSATALLDLHSDLPPGTVPSNCTMRVWETGRIAVEGHQQTNSHNHPMDQPGLMANIRRNPNSMRATLTVPACHLHMQHTVARVDVAAVHEQD